MTNEELLILENKNNAAIIAPAGHGKTEMVADMVEHFEGKQLVLTHTNAGVDAIRKRLFKRKIPSSKFTVSTIAAFCMKWSYSFHNTAKIDTSLSPMKKGERSKYYAQIYPGTLLLFQHSWIGEVLKNSYTGIVVDEYQDCTLIQHQLIKKLNDYLPVKVLGDPLQGIFGFKEPIVDWKNIEFEIIRMKLHPWRWEKCNPDLGEYLSELRRKLLPSLQGKDCIIALKSIDNVIQIFTSCNFDGYKLLSKLQQYDSVLYLTKWETDQLSFCRRMSGYFQQDEKEDCSLLFEYAELFDKKDGAELLLGIIQFVAKCATQVTKECTSYINRINKSSMDFALIKKHKDLGRLLQRLYDQKTNEAIVNVLKWFYVTNIFKFYRKELYQEMLRSLKYAQDHNVGIYDAMMLIRNDAVLQKRYTNFKYLSSRTLLSKGLEFDCVIIDTSKPLTAKEFYVAMTRAKKMIYVISDTSALVLKP